MRRKQWISFGKAAGALAGAFLAIWAVWSISAYQTQRTLEAEHYAQDRAERTPDDMEKACANLDAAALVECVAGQIEASREDQRAEYDLSAQERMAEWALWLMGISAGTMALTGAALWYVKLTLEATVAANNLLKDAAAHEHRPWLDVSIEPPRFHVPPSGDVRLAADFMIVLKNEGTTPAIDISLAWKVIGKKGDGFADFNDGRGKFPGTRYANVIFPGKESDPILGMAPVHQGGSVEDDASYFACAVRVTYGPGGMDGSLHETVQTFTFAKGFSEDGVLGFIPSDFVPPREGFAPRYTGGRVRRDRTAKLT